MLSADIMLQAFPMVFRNLRRKNNLTQAQVAELLDVSQITVCNWETGRRKPSFEKLFLFMEYINLYDDILKFYGVL